MDMDKRSRSSNTSNSLTDLKKARTEPIILNYGIEIETVFELIDEYNTYMYYAAFYGKKPEQAINTLIIYFKILKYNIEPYIKLDDDLYDELDDDLDDKLHDEFINNLLKILTKNVIYIELNALIMIDMDTDDFFEIEIISNDDYTKIHQYFERFDITSQKNNC